MKCDKHYGHRYWVGGTMDGKVDHLVMPNYPRTFGTILRDGQRSWYEIDDDASKGTEVVYRFIGHGREFPQREVAP